MGWPAHGSFASISDAIRASAPGARITLYPGVYRESLAIDRAIQIVGEGDPAAIVIESQDAPCVRSVGPDVAIRRVTLRARFSRMAENYAVDARDGGMRLERCRIESSFMGVGVNAAEAAIDTCQVEAAHIGVYVTAGARAQIERSVLGGASWAAVDVSDGSRVAVVSCDLKGNPGSGLRCTRAQARIENCAFSGNGRAPDARDAGLCDVVADQQGLVEVVGSQIADSATSGLMADHGARIVAADSEVALAQTAGACALGQGRLEMRRCRIRDGRSSGIVLGYGGLAEVAECEITGNAEMGVLVGQDSAGNFRRCLIARNGMAAVGLSGNARAVVEGSDLRNNGAGAWSVSLESWLAGSQNLEIELSAGRTYYLYGSKGGDRHAFKQFVTFLAPAFKPTAVLEVMARVLSAQGSVNPQLLDRGDLPAGKYFTARLHYSLLSGGEGNVAVTVVVYLPPDDRTGVVLAFEDSRYPGWLAAEAERAVAGAVYAVGMGLYQAFPCPRLPAWRMQFGDWCQEQLVHMSDGTFVQVKRVR